MTTAAIATATAEKAQQERLVAEAEAQVEFLRREIESRDGVQTDRDARASLQLAEHMRQADSLTAQLRAKEQECDSLLRQAGMAQHRLADQSEKADLLSNRLTHLERVAAGPELRPPIHYPGTTPMGRPPSAGGIENTQVPVRSLVPLADASMPVAAASSSLLVPSLEAEASPADLHATAPENGRLPSSSKAPMREKMASPSPSEPNSAVHDWRDFEEAAPQAVYPPLMSAPPPQRRLEATPLGVNATGDVRRPAWEVPGPPSHPAAGAAWPGAAGPGPPAWGYPGPAGPGGMPAGFPAPVYPSYPYMGAAAAPGLQAPPGPYAYASPSGLHAAMASRAETVAGTNRPTNDWTEGDSVDRQHLLGLWNTPISEQVRFLQKAGCHSGHVVEQVLSSPYDNTDRGWKRRRFNGPEVLEKWYRYFSREPHKDLRACLAKIETYKFDTLLGNIDMDVMGKAWNYERTKLISAIRNVLQCGAEAEQVLRALLSASRNSSTGNLRVTSYVESLLRDRTLILLAPCLLFDVLMFQLDESYKTAKYGQDSYRGDWDEYRDRGRGEDLLTLANRGEQAYILSHHDKNLTLDTLYQDVSHTTTLLERYAECVLNDRTDRERGARLHIAFIRGWEQARRQKEEGRLQVKTITLKYLAQEYVLPEEKVFQQCRPNQKAVNPGPRQASQYSDDQGARHQGRRVAAATNAPAPAAAPTPRVAAAATPPPLPPPRTGSSDKNSQRGGGGASALAPNRGMPPTRGGGAPSQGLAPLNASYAPPNQHSSSQPAGGGQRPYRLNPGRAEQASKPAQSSGHPENREWTDEDWRMAQPDFDRITELSHTDARRSLARIYPDNKHLNKVREGRPNRPDQGQQAPIDWCPYCYYRPGPENPPVRPNQEWRFGTGDGRHNPYYCKYFLRCLCEGGDHSIRKDFPEDVPYIKSCIRFPAFRSK